MIDKTNKNLIAFTVILFITAIYLHPIFLGKVDTPADIRDMLMYPWRYHEVDKKIKTVNLLDSNLINEKQNVLIPPQTKKDISFDLNSLNKQNLQKIKKDTNSKFYISFNFKSKIQSDKKINLGLSLIDSRSGRIFNPPFVISPLKDEWFLAYFDLNDLVVKLPQLNDLQFFKIQITAYNHNSSTVSSLYLKDLKLVCDDYSGVTTIHNPYNNDLIQMFTPFRKYFSDSLRNGIFPFWNNYVLTGTEFLAEPQVGYFHPVYLFVYWLFDHFTAHSVISFLGLFLCGVGAYFLASFWGLGFGASLFTSVVYMFNPFNVTWFSYEHMLMVAGVLPFLFLMYEKNILTGAMFNKYLIISSLLLGLMFLSGHLQYIYYALIFFLFFTIFRFTVNVIFYKENLFKHIFSIFFIFSFGVMIGAIVLIPFFPVFFNSHRISNPADFIEATSIPLKSFLGLIYPFYGGYPEMTHSEISNLDPQYRMGFFRNYVYFGLLPFIFSLFSLKLFFKNKLVAFFFLCVAFSLLICTGSPLFFLIKNILPGFNQLQHYRFLELYSLAVPFLAGIGFQEILKYKLKNYILGFIILVSVIDLMFYSSYFITWSKRSDYKTIHKNGVLEFLLKRQKENKKPFRVLPFAVGEVSGTKLKINVAQPNTLLPYGLEDVSGYSSFIPKDIYNLFVYIQTKDPNRLYPKEMMSIFTNPNIPYPIYNFQSKLIDLLNVKYFLVPNILTLESKETKKVFSGDCAIYENLDYLPRAFIVPNYRVIKDPKETIVTLDSDGFDAREEVVLEKEPGIGGDGETGNKSDIQFLKYENNNITLKVKTNASGFLVLGHNLTNNWKVKVNGKEAKHYKANLVQRAVYLPEAGEYKVEFWYFPKLFIIGGSISCFGILILVLIAIFLYLKNKKLTIKF